MRSWKLFGYVAAVVAHGCTDVLVYYDDWGYVQAGNPYDLERTPVAPGVTANFAYTNFRSICGVAYLALVLNPFSMYLIFVQVKFCLSLYKWSG